MEIADLTRCIR